MVLLRLVEEDQDAYEELFVEILPHSKILKDLL